MQEYDENKLRSLTVTERNRNPKNHHKASSKLFIVDTSDGSCEIKDSDIFKSAGGSLISLVEDHAVSILAIGGFVSDIWVWTDKLFKDRFCDITKIEGLVCKYENPDLIVVSSRWGTCPTFNCNFHEVCELNKHCFSLATKGKYRCSFLCKDEDGIHSQTDVPAIAPDVQELEEDDIDNPEVEVEEAIKPLTYCLCGEEEGERAMIGCDNPNCEIEWFHWACVNIQEIPEGDWICPLCSKNIMFS